MFQFINAGAYHSMIEILKMKTKTTNEKLRIIAKSIQNLCDLPTFIFKGIVVIIVNL